MWTKNYKNALITLATCCATGKSGATSSYNFSDNYFFNYKAPNGSIFDIRNWCESGTNGYYSTFLGFMYFDSNGGYGTTTVSVITNETVTTITNDGRFNAVYCAFGSDGTAPTESDYKLGNIITTLTNKSSIGTAVLNEDCTITTNYDVVIQATEDITVREIGLYKQFYRYKAQGNYALVNRIVLDEPVSIASGQTASIKFSVTTPTINFA